ncbi:MAG TPA: malate synthase A [Gemmatimonadales bacterium]|nr:malate synthase A [Gemmatimonadales bacterium]
MPASDPGIQVVTPPPPDCAAVLSPAALSFLAALARRFEPERVRLLERRRARQAELDAGRLPDFLPETRDVREREWTVAPLRPDLTDRRVEITGPVERKMMINALNSGANVFMADFEDANAPTWDNNVRGQLNVRDAVARTIAYQSPGGKRYALGPRTATLVVRPRGWHLVEKHLLVDGRPTSASLFDFGLTFFHTAAALIDQGSGPYFYLPKLESHVEARLWNDVFLFAQDTLGIPRGTIRATVLIETILAAFETDEILWELREHAGGLNCGRWDYIFSYIKKLRRDPERVLPDRARVTMDQPFLRAYAELVIRSCHRRGIHALGGMAAQIPIKRDPTLNAAALEKVRQDKLREVRQGHDGTWVSHPALVPVAQEVFAANLPGGGPHQIARRRDDVRVTARELLQAPAGPITMAGLRTNLEAGLQYLAAWLGGTGCVPINDLMEDAATAEISRAQVWQWLRHGARLEDGRYVNAAMVQQAIAELVASLPERVGAGGPGADKFSLAGRILTELTTGAEFAEFLTVVAYDYLD